MYCIDYYAKEIAAEQSGQSDSTFSYTRAYGFLESFVFSKWICPNLTETTISEQNFFKAEVYTCADAKVLDKNFEPDVNCTDPSET